MYVCMYVGIIVCMIIVVFIMRDYMRAWLACSRCVALHAVAVMFTGLVLVYVGNQAPACLHIFHLHHVVFCLYCTSQTGSGKTHTMQGVRIDAAVIVWLFHCVHSRAWTQHFHRLCVWVCCAFECT